VALLVDEVAPVWIGLVVLVLDVRPLGAAHVVEEAGHVLARSVRVAFQGRADRALHDALGRALASAKCALLAPSPQHEVLAWLGLHVTAVVGHRARVRLTRGERKLRDPAVRNQPDVIYGG